MIRKIAILTPFHNNFGGGEVYIDKLNSFIAKNCHEFSSQIYTSDKEIFKSDTRLIPKISSYKDMFKNILKVIRTLKEDKVDLVLLNDFYISQFSLLFRAFGLKTYSLIHGEISYLKIGNSSIKKIIIFIRRLLIESGVDKILSVNKTNMDYFTRKKIFKVSNFIECNSVNEIKTEEKEFDFMFCGRLTEVKNILKTVEIFNDFVENYNKKSKLVIIGDGEERNKLEEYIREHRLEQNILIKGFLKREEINEYYKKSKSFLLFSRSEGLPTVVLEALSYGVPCITTRVGSIPDIIKDSFNGFLIDMDSQDIILERMNTAISKYPDYYINCIETAQKYDIEPVLSDFVKLLI